MATKNPLAKDMVVGILWMLLRSAPAPLDVRHDMTAQREDSDATEQQWQAQQHRRWKPYPLQQQKPQTHPQP